MLSAHLPSRWEQYDAADDGAGSKVIAEEFGKLPRACETEGHQEIWNIVIVAARALLTPREEPMPGGPVHDRRNYVKHFEARPLIDVRDESDPKLAIPPARRHRTVFAKMTLHVNGDNTVWVLLHLKWHSNKMTYKAISEHYEELGRDPVCRFMARKQREGACGSNHECNAVCLWEVVKMERVSVGRTGEAKCVQCKCVPATS